MATYGWGRDYVLYDLSGCEGWAYSAWAIEADAWRDAERKSKGYIRQEIERLTRKKLKRGKAEKLKSK